MAEEKKEDATAPSTTSLVPRAIQSVVPIESIEDLEKLAKKLVESGLLPDDLATESKAFIALATAAELGLPMIRGVQGMAVINGRTCIWGETHRALAITNPRIDQVDEYFLLDDKKVEVVPTWDWKRREDVPDSLCFVARMHRKGDDFWYVSQFSVADAKRLKVYSKGSWISLWEKPGPWAAGDILAMLKARARRRNEREASPETLSGIMVREEAELLPPRDVEHEELESEPVPGQTASTISPDDAELAVLKMSETKLEELREAYKASKVRAPAFLAKLAEDCASVKKFGSLHDAWYRIPKLYSDEEGDDLIEWLQAPDGSTRASEPTPDHEPEASDTPAPEPGRAGKVTAEPADPDDDRDFDENYRAVKALVKDGHLKSSDLKGLLSGVYGVRTMIELSASQVAHLAGGLEDGSIWDHAKNGETVAPE